MEKGVDHGHDAPLRPDQEAHPLTLSEEMGRSPEEFVREAVLTFMEDYEDGRDAEAALAEMGPRMTQEEMEREIELEGRVHTSTRKDSLETRSSDKARVVRYMRERVLTDHGPYRPGDRSTGNWTGYWRYRVGDYRMICVLRDTELVVSVVRVGHRSHVYSNAT